MGYKQRDPSERELFQNAKDKLGIEFVRVGSVPGWRGSGENGGNEEEAVEVWLAGG